MIVLLLEPTERAVRKARKIVSKGLYALATRVYPSKDNPLAQAHLRGFIEGHRFGLEEDFRYLLQATRNDMKRLSYEEQLRVLSQK